MARKLKYKEVKTERDQALLIQNMCCAICHQLIPTGEEVYDHDHKTGLMRQVLHRSCNSLLGEIENKSVRYGVKNLREFLQGVRGYLDYHKEDRTSLIHPTYKTKEEKALNTKKAKAKAKAKNL